MFFSSLNFVSFCSLQTYFPKKGPKNLIKKRTDAVVNAKLRRSPFSRKKKLVRHPGHEEEELSTSFVRELTFFLAKMKKLENIITSMAAETTDAFFRENEAFTL